VPIGAALFGYHFPAVSGVGLTVDLLARLKDAHPDQFAGLKDSSGDKEHARLLGEKFGGDLIVFNGTDRIFRQALEWNASGCITALANLCSPYSRRVWDAWQIGDQDAEAQARLDAARAVVEKYPPAPPLLKALLARRHQFPHWPVRPPLLDMPATSLEKAAAELDAACHV
jgi:4-hydroxy-tetrahydrodipicolinate synthase